MDLLGSDCLSVGRPDPHRPAMFPDGAMRHYEMLRDAMRCYETLQDANFNFSAPVNLRLKKNPGQPADFSGKAAIQNFPIPCGAVKKQQHCETLLVSGVF